MQALERGELRPGALVGTESLLLFPCTPPPTPLFSGSVLAPRSRRPLDRYVGVTDRQVLELEAHRTRMNKVRLGRKGREGERGGRLGVGRGSCCCVVVFTL